MSARLLDGKTALVTGGGRGLGAEICKALATQGARVIVADVAERLAEEHAQYLRNRGFSAWSQRLDVSDAEQVNSCVGRIIEQEGSLEILVNNAGVDYTRPLEELEIAQWDHVINTNLRGPFLLCRAVASHMRAHRQGHIFNIASTAAKRSWPNASAYHASKWGLLGFSHALHAELRRHGVMVTAVIAGGMRTPFLLQRFPDIDPACLQEPANVAAAIVAVLGLPGGSVVPEISVLPMGETSWP